MSSDEPGIAGVNREWIHRPNSSWTRLVVAGPFEIAWTIGLQYSDDLTEPVPTLGTAIALAASVVLLAKAVQDLPIGTANAVWTGIGAVGTATLGVVLFDEPASSSSTNPSRWRASGSSR